MHSSGSWSSMPRRIADRDSPSSRSTRRISQSPSSAVSETSTSMPVLSSPQWRRASAAPACPVPNVPLTGGRAVTTSSDSEARYDAPSYTLPPSTVDQRRISIISSSAPSSFGAENRQSPYLPPVKSLASSRGSSFEIDSSERPQAPLTLPSLFTNSQSHAQPPQRGAYSNSPIDTEMRYQPSPQDQHPRYTGGPSTPTAPSSSYRAPSPGHPYTPPHYFHSSHNRSPRIEGGANFGSGQPMVVDSRSPFSTGAHPIDMAMDHFDHGRPGKRRRGNLPKHVTDLLRGWLNDHLHHPYPTEDEKQMLMQQTGLNINQVSSTNTWNTMITVSDGKLRWATGL